MTVSDTFTLGVTVHVRVHGVLQWILVSSMVCFCLLPTVWGKASRSTVSLTGTKQLLKKYKRLRTWANPSEPLTRVKFTGCCLLMNALSVMIQKKISHNAFYKIFIKVRLRNKKFINQYKSITHLWIWHLTFIYYTK